MNQEFFIESAKVVLEQEPFNGYAESGIDAAALIHETVKFILGTDPEKLLIEQGIVEQVS